MLTIDTSERLKPKAPSVALPWIQVAEHAPYFVTEQGETWTPIGQNDAISWPDLSGLYRRRDLPSVERYLKFLADHGVTVLRLMLEYCDGRNRFFEDPASHFHPNLVQLWDDLFALCEKYGLRILLTPFDTFWTWIRWEHHPYNQANGGPCPDRTVMMIDRRTREFIKARLAFATEHWGGSGALFAWDLWNEMHPAYARDDAGHFAEYIDDVSHFLKTLETRLYGRAHPQTVSVFGPLVVQGFQPQEFTVFTPQMRRDERVTDAIFRHPALDFASSHFYESETIDNPHNTIDPAISVGRLTQEALAEIRDQRPFFESEHGPIHAFKDRHQSLPEPFDDEYFRHIQWAHLASGGAGGGMRWPNRKPHVLTRGMREAQRSLSQFLPLIDWQNFRRQCLNGQIGIESPCVVAAACGDDAQAIVWLLRTDSFSPNGMLCREAAPLSPRVHVPGLQVGRYCVTAWDTLGGFKRGEFEIEHADGIFSFQTPPIVTDLALAIRRL